MIMITRPQTAQSGMLAWLLGGRGLGGPAAGYATFADYNAAVCLPLSAANKCPVPFDPTCVTPAQAAVAVCQNAWVTDPVSCHNVVCDASGQPAVTSSVQVPAAASQSPALPVQRRPVVTPPPAAPALPVQRRPVTPPPPSYNPQLSFITSRVGTALQVGDTWQVSITGAPPNTAVTVTGGQAGAQITNTMGTTDGAGNFSLSGTFTPDLVGTWSEIWKVGGTPVGSLIAFTVSAAPAAQSSSSTSTSTSTTGTTSDTSQQPSIDFGPVSVPFSDLSNTVAIGGLNIPYWALGLGGAGLLFLIVRAATK